MLKYKVEKKNQLRKKTRKSLELTQVNLLNSCYIIRITLKILIEMNYKV